MSVLSLSLDLQTNGNGEIHDITQAVQQAVQQSGLENGTVTIFCPSATSGLTTLEYESGCIQDLQRLFDEIISPSRDYAHNARWGDGNGHSHLRSSLVGPSLTIPFQNKKLILGTWQQIVLIDFDNRSRDREIFLQFVGE